MKQKCLKLYVLSSLFLKRNVAYSLFFREINLSLSTIVNEYNNIMLIGDLNLNTKSENNNYYSDLCDTFDLTNLIKLNTCFKSSSQTSIDVNKSAKKFSKIWSSYYRAQWLSQNDLDVLLLLLFRITTENYNLQQF